MDSLFNYSGSDPATLEEQRPVIGAGPRRDMGIWQLIVTDRSPYTALNEWHSWLSGSSPNCANRGGLFFAQARNQSPELIFENFFLPAPGSRFTPNSQAAQLDKVAKRGNTLDMR